MSRVSLRPLAERRCHGIPLLAGLVCAALTGCASPATLEEAGGTTPLVHVRTVEVRQGDIQETVLIPGRIAPRPGQTARVSFQVPGRVLEVVASEGESVREGQLLGRIDAQPFIREREQVKSRIDEIQANLDAALKNAERNKNLFERGIAAGREVEESEALSHSLQAELESARAALANAELQVRRCEIFAPLSGVVVKRFLNPGEQVSGSPSDPVLELANLDRVEMNAGLPVRYLSVVTPGDRMAVTSPAFPNSGFEGRVVAIGAQVEPETDTVQIRLALSNPRHQLKIDLFVEAALIVASRHHVTLVPDSALVRVGGEDCVFVAEKTLARKRPVELGLKAGGNAEIVSGLSPGERVLTSGNYGLVDEARIIVDQ